MASSSNWTWSPEHQNYYYVTYDHQHQPVYHWSEAQSQPAQPDTESGAPRAEHGQQYQETTNHSSPAYPYQLPQAQYSYTPTADQTSYSHGPQYGGQASSPSSLRDASHVRRRDSGWGRNASESIHHTEPTQYTYTNYSGYSTQSGALLHHSHPQTLGGASYQPNDVIRGTQGRVEDLDSSYRMRIDAEAHRFFVPGRVFAVLWTETASETSIKPPTFHPDGSVRYHNDAFTVGRFGQPVYSQIRRFVIVLVKRTEHFVYACPISTYSGRGTNKPGCDPSKHAIVYFSNSYPRLLPNENALAIKKDPIKVIPSNPTDTMDPASRIRFGKVFPVEWNVKVKDVGKVHPDDMETLLQYYKDEA